MPFLWSPHRQRLTLGNTGYAICALPIERHGVILDAPAHLVCNHLLTLFNFRVVKLFHLATRGANKVIVVLPLIELVHRFATLKIAAQQNTSLLKLRQHTVHRRQTDVRALIQQSVPQLCTKLYDELLAERGAVDNFSSFLRVCCTRYLALQLSGEIPQDVRIPIRTLTPSSHRSPPAPAHTLHH